MKKAQIKFLVFLFAFLIVLASVYALSITQIQPSGNLTTSNSSVLIKYNFTISNMTNLNFSWGGTNYSLFDKSLVLFYNFDNRSSLGENDTRVLDLGRYKHNGTVIGWSNKNVTWTSLGKYGGAFNLTNKSKISTTLPRYNITNKLTFSFWIYLEKYKTGVYNVVEGKDNGYRSAGIVIETNKKLTFNILNGTYVSGDDTNYRHYVQTNDAIPLNEWIYVTATYSNDTGELNLYYNGDLIKTSSGHIGMTIYDSGNAWSISSTGSAYTPMLIDDFMFLNRSLSSSEVKQFYDSSLTKYDSTNWTLQPNKSNLLSTTIINASNPTYSTDYVLCSTNLTDSICSIKKSLLVILPLKKITSQFGNLLSSIHNNFYGAVSALGLVSGNNSANSWYREKWLEAKLNYGRRDMGFSATSYYYGISNWGFENWYNLSMAINSTKSETVCFSALGGWGCTAYQYNQSQVANVSRSTDAHSGTYSLNSTGDGNSSMHHGIYGLMYLSKGDYNFSIWVKSTATVNLAVRNQATLTYPCTTDISSGSGNWERLSCNFTISSGNTHHKVTIEDTGTTTFLVDDFELLKDGKPLYFSKGNLTLQTNLANWTYQNKDTNQKLMWIANYMSYFNANVSKMCSTLYSRCQPLNYTLHGDMVIDFLNTTSNNHEYDSVIEVENWNEPYGSGFFLPSGTIQNRSHYHNLIYNATKQAVNTYNSSIHFYGMSGYFGTTDRDWFIEQFVANFSDEDGYTLHTYGQDQDMNNISSVFESDMTKLMGYCSTYSANCSRVIWTEWGTWNHTLKNTTAYKNIYSKLIADAISFQLNNYANITTLLPYQFRESQSNEPRWGMTYYPNFTSQMYNVTKNFAHLCPAGGEVYNSTGNDTIKIVSCKSGSNYSVILINTGTESRNITINNGNKFPFFRNYETDHIYLGDTEGNFELGVLDSYDILYLVNYSETGSNPSFYGGATGIPTPEPIPTPQNQTTTPEEESLLDRITNKIDDLADKVNEIVPGDFKLNAWQWILVIMGIFAFIGIIVYSITYEIKNT